MKRAFCLMLCLGALSEAVNGQSSPPCGQQEVTFARRPAWSPDGTKIAFECTGICVMNADGTGKTMRGVGPGTSVDRQPAWSSDGSRIAFENGEGQIVIARVDDKRRTTVGSEPASDPAWSPSGEKIAFSAYAAGQHAVFTSNVDGTHRVRLTTDGDNEEPSWSPDGRKIAFTSERDGMPATYVMNADGTNQTRLFDTPVALSHLVWLPVGRRIAFVALGRFGVDGIYAIDEDGSHQQRLTGGVENRDEHPAWSPDGRTIAFTRIHRRRSSHLYLVNADGSQLKELSDDAESAAWMPDGRTIAFKALGDGRRPIRSIAVDGTGLATLITSFDTFGDPVFSRDGRRVAFQNWYGGTGVVHVMKSNGSGDATIAQNVYTAYGVRPAWSADGGKLAITHERTADRCEGIDVVNADGTGRTALTSSADSNPAWSPDDKRIAFVSRRDGYDAIYVMNADGSGPVRITSTVATYAKGGSFHSYDYYVVTKTSSGGTLRVLAEIE